MVPSVIIRKEKIKIRTSDEQYALQVRKELTDSLQFDIIRMMENVFAQIESPDVYINIDRLKIDLGTITSKEFEQHFVQLVEEKLTKELQKQFPDNGDFAARQKNTTPGFRDSYFDKNPSSQFSQPGQQRLNALLYFLEKGIYPWWYKEGIRQTPEELLNNLTKDETDTLILTILSTRKKVVGEEIKNIIKRLFIHLPKTKSESVVRQLLNLHNSTLLTRNTLEIFKNKDDLKKIYAVSERDFYSQLFEFLLSENIEVGINTIENFIKELEHQQKNNAEAASIEKEKKNVQTKQPENTAEATSAENENVKRKEPDNPGKEGIYVSNAGLILLHPFLQSFFAGACLLDGKNQFISTQAQQKAAVLLSYLQSGNDEYKEWEMALNKIICGMQYDDLVPDGMLITEKEKEESRSLLQAVVNYWEALKGASIESMQNTFFLREGKITWKEEHWLLQIERNGFDILIERLPWGLGTIKFPWLQHLIFTEW